MHEAIVDLIEKGNPRGTSFKLVGLHPDTGFAWLAQGREHPDEHPEYARLMDDIIQAEAKFQSDMLAEVVATATSTMPNTWQAAAWLLERRNPEEFAKREKHELTAGDRPLIQLNQVVLADPEAREQSRSLLKRVTAGGASLALGPGVGDPAPEEQTG